jgi:hypothetical protein
VFLETPGVSLSVKQWFRAEAGFFWWDWVSCKGRRSRQDWRQMRKRNVRAVLEGYLD